VGDQAANYRARRRGAEAADHEMETEEIAGRQFVGSRISISSGRSTLSLFAGLDDDVRSLVLSDELDAADKRAVEVSQEVEGTLRESVSGFPVWQDVTTYGDPIVIHKGTRAPPVGLRKGTVDVNSGYDVATVLGDPEQPAVVVDDDATILQASMEGTLAVDEAEKEADRLSSLRTKAGALR
jgi:hypothetical protein